MREYGFSLTRILTYKDRILPYFTQCDFSCCSLRSVTFPVVLSLCTAVKPKPHEWSILYLLWLKHTFIFNLGLLIASLFGYIGDVNVNYGLVQ